MRTWRVGPGDRGSSSIGGWQDIVALGRRSLLPRLDVVLDGLEHNVVGQGCIVNRVLNSRNDSSRRRNEERVWGEMYQGLLKRVGAGLAKLEILEKQNLGRRGQSRFMKGNEQWENKR